MALGATYPMAVRWLAETSSLPARASGLLYAVNTIGAAGGAALAGFVLISATGVSGTIGVGIVASAAAALVTWGLSRRDVAKRGAPRLHRPHAEARAQTRVIAMVVGPTTYAFAAALAAVIAGVGIGSGAGSWIAGRVRRPALWLAFMLAAAALATAGAASLAGRWLPLVMAALAADAARPFDDLLRAGLLRAVGLMIPTAASDRGDMLAQRPIAHLPPLLLHDNPRACSSPSRCGRSTPADHQRSPRTP